MKNKLLVIKGHSTRGKEVIEILEMLGGKNGKLEGDSIESLCGNNPQGIYYIQTCNNLICIRHADSCELNDFIIFTLEEFLEKYPYKVGDKVKTVYGKIGNVSKCKWDADNNCMIYKLDTSVYNSFYFAHELIPYKEEIKAEDHKEIYTDSAIVDDSKTDIIINGEKLIAPNGFTIKTATTNGDSLIVEYMKNKPQYPKTYKECCEVLGINTKANDAQGYKADDIICLQELLIYRDAYWKIAGEEMGLFEHWEPDFSENSIYAIGTYYGTIEKRMVVGGGILLFPTEEMRDAFFENFKDLIEKCKEFL